MLNVTKTYTPVRKQCINWE